MDRDKIRAKEKKVSKKLSDMADEIKKELRYVGNTTSTVTNKVSVNVLWIDWMMTSFKGNLATVITLLDALDSAEKENAEWEEKEAAVCPEDFGFEEYIPSLQAENTCLRKALDSAEKLKEFARHVIKTECWAIDGADIQEKAEELGLIEPHIATQDDVDEDSDYEVGDTIPGYKFTDVLKGSK